MKSSLRALLLTSLLALPLALTPALPAAEPTNATEAAAKKALKLSMNSWVLPFAAKTSIAAPCAPNRLKVAVRICVC